MYKFSKTTIHGEQFTNMLCACSSWKSENLATLTVKKVEEEKDETLIVK